MPSTNPTALAATGPNWLLSVPNAQSDQHLVVVPGGAGSTTAYTLVYDLYVPSSGAGGWVPFFQSNTDNANDADLFGKVSGDGFGIGIGGNYQGNARLDAWNRIAFTVEEADGQVTITKYINGEKVGTQVSADPSRYTIDREAGFLIFSDEDGETSPLYLSGFAYAGTVLTGAEIAGLGGANREGIFSGKLADSLAAAGGSEFRFDNGALTPAVGAATLTPRNIETPVTTADDAGIAAAPAADRVLSIPAATPEQALLVTPGGAGTATSYSIAFDIFVPSEGTSGWISFFQANPENGDDADLFGNVSGDGYGIGIGGNYQGKAQLDAWNRIAFTVDTADGQVTITKYINGEKVGAQVSDDAARYAIDREKGFLVFSDNDGETSQVHVSNFAYIEFALNEAQLQTFGAPAAGGIVPAGLEELFLAFNGSEFRFNDGTLAPAVGAATLTPVNIEPAIETPAEAGIPVVTAPGGDEDAPIRMRSISDLRLTKDADILTIDLAGHFTAEGLTFSVTNSDDSVATAKLVDGDKLEIDVSALGFSDVKVSAVDAEGQVYTDDFRVRVAGPNAYTIAVMPDTQDYTYAGAGQETFNRMTQWLADNAGTLNLRFVTSVGDVTNNNTVSEWTIAKEAFTKLNGVVPYALLPGNHDQGGGASDYTSLQTDYFSVEYLQEHSTLGGVYDQEPGETKNAWYTFEGSDGTPWIVVSLEFGARDDVLRWASEVLDTHADHRAILTTHHYTNMGTRADNYSGPLFAEGTGKDYGIGASAENANDGEDMWQELVSTHNNISFVFSGHVFGDGAETIVSYNDAGEPVYQMFVNYQNGVSLEATGNGDPARGGNGGNGAIRLVTIDPDNGGFFTETYLADFDEYLTGARGTGEPSRDGSGEVVEQDDAAIQPVTFTTDTLPDGESGVLVAPRFNPQNGLRVTPGFEPADGGENFDAYTLVYDVRFPTQGGLASIFQSDLSNVTDGDLWLNFRGDHAVIGTDGQDEGRLPLDRWLRVVVTLERVGEGGSTYVMNKYVDGVLQGTQTVGAAYNIGADGFLLFADDSNETPEFSLSSFAFAEKALSAEEVAALGGATANGPFAGGIDGVNVTQFDFTAGDYAPTVGEGSITRAIGSGLAQQLTGPLREHQETFDNVDLGAPSAQFRANAGSDIVVSAGAEAAATVRLDGSASVDRLGQIARYEWVNADGEIVADTREADVALDAGVHRLTLRAITADGRASADQVTVAVTDDRTLLHETFDDGNADGWTLPGERWQVAGSAISRKETVEGIAAPEAALRAYDGAAGVAVWNGEGSRDWAGYTVSATLTAEDQLGLGVVAYYKDADNYYRLSFDIADNARTLVRVRDGVETVLAHETATSPFDRAFAVELAVNDGKLLATLDGEALFGGAVTDEAPLSGGTAGVWSEGQRQVFFDDILVRHDTLIADAGKAVRVVADAGSGTATVALSALASLGLDAAGDIAWSRDGVVLANGAQAEVALDAGTHLLRLDLAGEAGRASDTVQVEVIAASDVLLHEDFSDGEAQGFRFVDEGELGAPADWSVRDGALQQAANRFSRELGGSGSTAPTAEWNLNWSPLGDGIHALRKGAYAVYEGEGASEWRDYSVETTFTATSGAAVGLLLHYQDADNYYKFELDNDTGLPQLFSLKDGIEQTLWQGPHRYDTDGANHLRADIVDGKVQVWLNGTALFTKPIEIHDTEKGTFGLYNWRAGDGVTYDDVRVVNLRDADYEIADNEFGGRDIFLHDAGALVPALGTTARDRVFYDGEQTVIVLPDTIEQGALLDASGDSLLLGNALDNVLLGNAGNNRFIESAGNDRVDGGRGHDTLVLTGRAADYTIGIEGGLVHVTNTATGSVQRVSDVEALAYADGNAPLLAAGQSDIHGLYRAFLGREPDGEGFDYWLGSGLAGEDVWSIADHFAASDEFAARSQALDTAAFVNALYADVLARDADDAGRDYWTRQIDEGSMSRASVALSFARSDEAQNNVGLLIPPADLWPELA
ncbi:MAG: DUF4214 domain-containing protein [Pseudochelatococcus sp.]|jgi:hypothetical protein|uniref:DUF4214 domain-containing protein n=1 Tax=Pseudochelatococcus sp. TaxID=2020869 RepID=UPI003D94F462